MKTPIARSLYLIVRGPRSEHHKAPFHPIVVCTRLHTAKWESRDTSKGDTVFECMADGGNWLLVRYKGYDLSSSGHFILFDGKRTDEVSNHEEIKRLLSGATWWSYDRIPNWLSDYGIKYPQDNFTKNVISEDSGMCLMPFSKEQKLRDKLDSYDEPEWLIPTNKN
jgi:hypothetical protein